jgi:hypothetical protein
MVVFSLRKAAEVLADCEGWLRLPGWESDDEACPPGRAAALRAVARAIAGDGVDPDVGTDVPLSTVGEVVRYLADMIED